MPLTNRQFETINRKYDERRLIHYKEMKEREAAAYASFPRLSEIDSEMSTLFAKKALMLINSAPDSPEKTDEKLDDLSLEKRTLLRLAGFKNGTVEPEYDCPLCRDTGFIDGKKCACFKREETALLGNAASLCDILKKENFSNFDIDKYPNSPADPDTGLTPRATAAAVLDYCRNYTEHFSENYENLCLSGKTGVGKTFLAHCIAAAVLDRGGSVLFFSAANLISAFEDDQFRTTEETRHNIQLIFSCDLLIIDDLAASFNNSFAASSILRCLDERHIKNKNTVITTNLTLNELRKTYSDRIFSRIYGNYKWLFLSGNDIRTYNKSAQSE